jgi:hypothetical protein
MTQHQQVIRIREEGYTHWFVRLVPERFRWAHRWYAQTHGYFWLPCILCGRESGGHEWRNIDGKPAQVSDPTRGPTAGVGICPWCTRAGKGSSALPAEGETS